MREGLENLKIWKRAHDLAIRIGELTQGVSDRYLRMKNQIENSSNSVADNIAEAYGAYYFNDKIKNLYIARKEATETINHLMKFRDRKLLPRELCEKLILRYEEEIKAINAYIKYICSKRDKNNSR